MTTLPRILLVAALVGAAMIPARAADFPGGGSVGLEPPPGMLVLPQVPAIVDPDRKGSISIEETSPEHSSGIESQFAREAMFAAPLSQPEDFPVAGAEGRIRRATTSTGAHMMNLWLVLLRRPDGVALVTAAASTERYPAEVIERSLRSLVFRARPTVADDVAKLSFEVTDMAGFRPVGGVGASALYLTEGPQDVVLGFAQPVVRVTQRSERDLGPDERLRVTRRMFGLTEDLDRVERATESQEGDVLVTEGSATDPVTGQPLYLFQAFVFTDSGAIRAIAMAPLPEADRLRPALLRLARAIRPRAQGPR